MMMKAFLVVALIATLAFAEKPGAGSFSSNSEGSTVASDVSSSSAAGTPAPTTGTPAPTVAPTSNGSTPEPTMAPQPQSTISCPLMAFGSGDQEVVASLGDYALGGAVTVMGSNNDTYVVSPCTAVANCSGQTGFVSQVAESGACTLFNYAQSAVTGTVSADGANFTVTYADAAANTLTLEMGCGEEADGTTAVVSMDKNGNQVLAISTKKLCPEKELAKVSVPAGTCKVTFSRHGDYYEASLNGIVGKALELDGKPAEINPCGPKKTFNNVPGLKNCPDTMGYMAYMEGDNCVVLDERSAYYNPNVQIFNTTFSTVITTTAAPKSPLLEGTDGTTTTTKRRTVLVKCGTEDSVTGEVSQEDPDTVTYYRKDACAEETTAPAPEEKSGLSTGAIVGIVIGALALVVIILVICRWKTTKSEEEGEYERV